MRDCISSQEQPAHTYKNCCTFWSLWHVCNVRVWTSNRHKYGISECYIDLGSKLSTIGAERSTANGALPPPAGPPPSMRPGIMPPPRGPPPGMAPIGPPGTLRPMMPPPNYPPPNYIMPPPAGDRSPLPLLKGARLPLILTSCPRVETHSSRKFQ